MDIAKQLRIYFPSSNSLSVVRVGLEQEASASDTSNPCIGIQRGRQRRTGFIVDYDFEEVQSDDCCDNNYLEAENGQDENQSLFGQISSAILPYFMRT